MRFGGWPEYSQAWFNGLMDEVRIFHRALSLHEMDSLYHLNNWVNGKVIGIKPSQNALTVSPNSDIQVSFNKSITTNSLNDTSSFIVSGNLSGRHRGSFSFGEGNVTATFTPSTPFKNNEVVTVNVTNNIKDGVGAYISPFESQ